MPDSGLTKNVFLRKSVKVSFSGSPQHPKSNKPTSYRYDTFLNASQKSIIKVSLKCHAALRHPEISKPQSLARITKLMKQATIVPNRGKQRTQVGQAACPKWASSVPKTEPKVSIRRNTRKGNEKKRHLNKLFPVDEE